MTTLDHIKLINESLIAFFLSIDMKLALPATIIFVICGLLITFQLNFIQLKMFGRFLKLLRSGAAHDTEHKRLKTITSFHALFAAMATSLGMGNVVGPSIAIIAGGPGALFWLVAFAFLGGAIRFVEVTFALNARQHTQDGKILGGPMQYLRWIHPMLSTWYAGVMMFLLAVWSGLQTNTLANILRLEGIPQWVTGLALGAFMMISLAGGAKRIGNLASRMVPIMFFSYISFALLILFKDTSALIDSIKLIFSSILDPRAAFGGFAGTTVLQAMRAGIYKSIYITEAGMGTSAIPHSMADVKRPTDQGILAMYSIVADAILASISGLLVLVTGIWLTVTRPDNTLVYLVFKNNSEIFGKYILIFSISLLILTTIMGNSFNGSQSFAYFSRYKYMNFYYAFVFLMIVFGAVQRVELIWALGDVLITFVAVPHIISLVILAARKRSLLMVQ